MAGGKKPTKARLTKKLGDLPGSSRKRMKSMPIETGRDAWNEALRRRFKPKNFGEALAYLRIPPGRARELYSDWLKETYIAPDAYKDEGLINELLKYQYYPIIYKLLKRKK